jgi:hypothetical protein
MKFEIPKEATPISARSLKNRLKKAHGGGVEVCASQVWERHQYCSDTRLPSHFRPFKVAGLKESVVARETPQCPPHIFQPEEPSIHFRYLGYHENFPSSRCTFYLLGELLFVTLDAGFVENSLTCFRLQTRKVEVTFSPLVLK